MLETNFSLMNMKLLCVIQLSVSVRPEPAEPAPRRKPGRPKGSKNKHSDMDASFETEESMKADDWHEGNTPLSEQTTQPGLHY